MERSTEPKATSDGARLNRVQMARALREGAGAEDGRGAEERTTSVGRNWSMDSGLRRVGARVTLGVLLTSTLTAGRITALRADFLQHATAGAGEGGSIPGSPGPSVGSDGQGHSPIQDTNQEQQKTMFSKLTGVTAAIAVGASVTVAGAQNAAVQWKVEDGGNGHWYQPVISPGITWQQSRSSARAMGGDLVTISNAQESAWIFHTIVSDPGLWWSHPTDGPRHGPWIGLFQDTTAVDYSEPAGGWKWVDGTPAGFTSWSPSTVACENQPSDCRCNPAEGCGMNFASYYTPMPCQGTCGTSETWTAAFNDMGAYAVSFVIEWSADCNHDNIVDYGQILLGQLVDANGNGIPDICESPTCHDVDLYRNGRIDGADLAALLSEWGPVNATTRSDFNHDGRVDGSDLAFLLSNWGPCPQ